jgi:hypothetical protein
MYAAERLMQLMLTRGVLLNKEEYQDIARPAIEWAFEKHFDGRVGREPLRLALEEAAFLARDGYVRSIQLHLRPSREFKTF